MVWKLFSIDLELTLEVYENFLMYDNFFGWMVLHLYLVICQKSLRTFKVNSERTQKNSETMNFCSGFESLGGFCGVEALFDCRRAFSKKGWKRLFIISMWTLCNTVYTLSL